MIPGLGHRILVSRYEKDRRALESGVRVAEQRHPLGHGVLVAAGLVDADDVATPARKGRRKPARYLGTAGKSSESKRSLVRARPLQRDDGNRDRIEREA